MGPERLPGFPSQGRQWLNVTLTLRSGKSRLQLRGQRRPCHFCPRRGHGVTGLPCLDTAGTVAWPIEARQRRKSNSHGSGLQRCCANWRNYERFSSMTNIPTQYKSRLPLWIAMSHRFGSRDDPFTTVEIQQLGFAERLLLDMEARAIAVARDQREKDELGKEPFLINDLVLHSRFWLFGLYETLRTYRQRVGKDVAEFAVIRKIFDQVELARMPLAKHEAKGRKSDLHYPETLFDRESGWIGWNVIDPTENKAIPIFRTDIANQFLAAMTR
jgi:hypothetical protein